MNDPWISARARSVRVSGADEVVRVARQQLGEGGVAAAALGAGAASLLEVFDGTRALGHRIVDRAVVHPLAIAHVHDS